MAVVPETLIEALRDRYVVEKELGHGGMATVYLATDLKHDRQVALKVLRPELTAILGRERFLAEIRLTAKLDHPNLLTLLDSGEAGGALYYVLPYVRGGSLRQRLDQERHLPIEEAVQIGCQIAAALDHAHALGIIHRDIKPENILLQDGIPKLTDFGIALAVREAGGERLTETGMVIGTPQYMSPEQATGDRLLDSRSDIYSLGAVVYEMLAGEAPVLGGSAQAIIAKLITERPTPLRVVRSTISEGLSQVVERSMAKVPADRFASGAIFARALTSAPAVVARPFPRRAVTIGLGVVALALLIGVLTRVVTHHLPAEPSPSASLIAVLPATTSAPDSTMSRLGRDLVFTLAANLGGAGELRSVDPQLTLTQVGGDAATRSRAEDLALGRRLGAGGVVRGTLVRLGREVRWDVALLSSTTGTLLAQASVTAPAESIRAFTDTATRSLLRQIWERGQAPSPSLDAAVKTRSVPALKAFLTGETEIATGQWGEAVSAYNQAIAADSTFWLAYWRLWFASTWSEVEVDTNLFIAARVHRFELPDRERLLIEACTCLADSLPRAVRLAKQVTERFPDDWFGWMFYAGYLVYTGPVLGYTAADARAALERTVALKPGLVDGWDHLMKMSLGKDTTATARSLHALDSLGSLRDQSSSTGNDVSLWYRLASQLPIAGGAAPHPLIDSVARAIAASDSLWGHLLAANALLRFGFPAAQMELDRLVLSAGVAKKFIPAYQRSVVTGWAMRGAWDSALVAADQVVLAVPGERDIMNRYRMGVFAAWLGAVAPARVAPAGRAATQAVNGLPADEHAEAERITLAWLDGLLAVVRHDRRGLDAAKATAHRSHAAVAQYVERSLRALSLKLDGATARLGDSLLAADEGSAWDQRLTSIETQILSVNRLTEAAGYLTIGDTAQAVKLLVWHEAELNGENIPPQIFAPFAYLQLARIEEAQGQATLAREHYEQFLRRYDSPDAPFQPMVTQARAALAALTGAATRLTGARR
ncbi:MAG: serine/threonine-protein kinase [Gemmatimonadales bacterium]